MSDDEPLSESAKRKIRTLYSERYKRIKDERKTILNTFIGLSGGCVVLSITFLDKIAPHKRVLPLVIVAWCLFGLALLVSINALIVMIRRSQKFQRELQEILQNIPVDKTIDISNFEADTESPPSFLSPELFSGILFGLGVLALAAFAITNLVAG
jgi:hypothetical protein